MSAHPYEPAPVFADLQNEPEGGPFYDAVAPADFPTAQIRYRNDRWARRVGLDALSDEAWIDHFARFAPLPRNLARPLALRYHGHQFRSYNPEIGDGRGFLFAQLRDDQSRLLDLGTKGSGRTPYSRTADGRLTLKGGVRELLASAMLEALGVYSSKTFSVIETGEALERHDEPSPTRACVLVRLSHSHVRFGAFQRLAFERDEASLEKLVRYCARAFFPQLESAGAVGPLAAALFDAIVAETARLAAQWMTAGFAHGVLNTDNMNVTGESFDYGPWRFAPTADPGFTAAYFDHTGLYAFGRQAEAGAWNLAQLGGALSLLADAEALNAALTLYGKRYARALTEATLRRLGLAPSADAQADEAFAADWLTFLSQSGAPFEQAWFDWCCGRLSRERAAQSPIASMYRAAAFNTIERRLLDYEPARPERASAPYFSGERPYALLIDEVEAIWAPIAEADDWSRLDDALRAIEEIREAYAFESSAWPPAP